VIPRQRLPSVLGVIVLTGLAVVRVVSTYKVFNGTYDEPAHIACGMEWLQWGSNACELQHPPLARVAVALGPFLRGFRLAPEFHSAGERTVSFYEEGNSILYAQNQYWTNLAWARAGTLPFLIFLCATTYLWARRWFGHGFGEASGFCAVLLLVCTAPVLGHAGLATNDLACAAGATFALYEFLRWLEQPRMARAIWWGAATAVAVLCKFSNVPFLLACYAAGLALRPRGALRGRLRHFLAAGCIAFVLAWAMYRFTVVAPGMYYGTHHPVIDGILSKRPLLHSAWSSVMATPLPLAEPAMGLLDLFVHNAVGHDAYLLGEWSQSGWWYFFPVVLAVKSPIGLLALAALGVWLVRRRWRATDWKQSWQQALTVVFLAAILVVCILSRIDLGVRHILPVYPLLAILGGHGMVSMFQRSRSAAIAAGLLAAWAAADSARAHPDYLAHFNEFAGSHPERILCESDLDWGQDLDRLRKRLEQRGVQEFSIAYFGTVPLEKAGLPRFQYLSAAQPAHGYIAVSLHQLNIDYKKNGSFGWLKAYMPLERVGKSIDLFYVAP